MKFTADHTMSAWVRPSRFARGSLVISNFHWRRLGKNTGWANQNIGGEQKVVKSDKCMGDSQLLGARARAAPKSTLMTHIRKCWLIGKTN